MTNKKLSKTQLEVAHWLWLEGHSTVQISGALKRPEHNIANQIEAIRKYKKEPVSMEHETEGLTGDRVAQAHWLWKQGLSIKEIATALYMPATVIKANMRAIKRYIPEQSENAA